MASDAAVDRLRLGDIDSRPWGQTTCHFGLSRPECDKPATRHFMWIADHATSNACDEHAAYVHSRDTTATPFDEHAFSGDCGMPGTMWHVPFEDEPEGYCYTPSPDDVSAMTSVDEGVRRG